VILFILKKIISLFLPKTWGSSFQPIHPPTHPNEQEGEGTIKSPNYQPGFGYIKLP
jgi:hypothetical protein